MIKDNSLQVKTEPANETPYKVIGYDSNGTEMEGVWNGSCITFPRAVVSWMISGVDLQDYPPAPLTIRILD